MINKKRKALFIFPYAGASAYSMNGLAQELRYMTPVILEYPGRGQRYNEELRTNIKDLVDDLYLIIKQEMVDFEEYSFFGHSMGTLVGYLVIHRLLKDGFETPKHFFVSGRGGPSKLERNNRYLLPSKEFRDKLGELGGCPEEVLKNDELMEFFEPILKADFEVIEKYEHEINKPINIQITCFYGSEDDTSIEDMELWQKETDNKIEMILFPGNHFFIFEFWKEIAIGIESRVGNYEFH